MEYCVARIPTLLPLSLAEGLSIHNSRYLTAGYRSLICSLSVETCYRTACDIFNETQFRAGTEMELPVATFTRDVINEGLRVIIAKNMHAEDILIRFGFDPLTGKYKEDDIPEEMKNWDLDYATIVIEDPEKMLIDIANSDLEDNIPDDPPGDSSDGFSDEPPPDASSSMSTSGQSESGDCKKSPEEESPEAYSKPDTDYIPLKRKRRVRKYKPTWDPVEVESIAKGYVKWFNDKSKHEFCKILHAWKFEKDVHQVLYIAIDAVYVSEQSETHVKGGKEHLPEERTRISHWDVSVEWENQRYLITDADLNKAMVQLLAFILENGFYKRHLIFFTDGESCIFTAVKRYFSYWEYDIYLDFMHAQKKLFDLLSMAIKSKRVNDPRQEPELYKRGAKKGQVKKWLQISLSRLYARRASSILFVGNIEELLYYLDHINPEDIANEKVLQDLKDYFSLLNKGQYVTCYALRRRLGLRNSSNGVENVNYQLVSNRQKNKGMSWRVNGSAALASLKALKKNKEDTRWYMKNTFSFSLSETNNCFSVSHLRGIPPEDFNKYGPKTTPRMRGE